MVLCGEECNCFSSSIRQSHLQPKFIDSLPSAPSSPEPPTNPPLGSPYTVPRTPNSTPINGSRPQSLYPADYAKDDIAVRITPWGGVVYLSRSWKEEEIWSSWKYIVSERKACNDGARLENASWRTWAKSKDKLNTISPESLNWYVLIRSPLQCQLSGTAVPLLIFTRLKECDVTWLYGPLRTSPGRSLRMPCFSPVNGSCISKFDSSLLKHRAAGVQAQQCHEAEQRRDQTGAGRTISDRVIFPFSLRSMSGESPGLLASVASPGTGGEKHIHFNEQVEQCIALEMTDNEDEEIGSCTTSDDRDSDDGAIVMKSKSKLPPTGNRQAPPRTSFGADSKTIVTLPPTTLKYREDKPESPGTAVKHSNGWCNGRELSTVPPPNPLSSSTRISIESREDGDTDMDWQQPSLNGDASDIFTPYEDEEDVISEGLFRKVVDVVNTVKDIAYLIWNTSFSRQSWKEGEGRGDVRFVLKG
jgi:hypothetical protein